MTVGALKDTSKTEGQNDVGIQGLPRSGLRSWLRVLWCCNRRDAAKGRWDKSLSSTSQRVQVNTGWGRKPT